LEAVAAVSEAAKPENGEKRFVTLFVDDEPAILRGIKRMLGDSCEVLTADSGADALALMQSRRVDVLVSDIDMPQMTGLELVRRARKEFPSTVRVLLTGAGTLERALSAINEGEVARFLTKPFDPTVFRETIRELGARILKMRADGEVEAERARRAQFFEWVESHYPGTLKVDRGARGDVTVDVERVRAAIERVAPSLRRLIE
jgi:YesN/AraC family two-component response regulator